MTTPLERLPAQWSAQDELHSALQHHDHRPDQFRHGDAVPIDAAPWSREFFIPIRRRDLTNFLAERIEGEEDRQDFLRWCDALWECYSRNYVNFVETLKDLYAPLDPDLDHLGVVDLDEALKNQALDDFFVRFDALLKLANYQRLTDDEIQEAIGAASDFGVRLSVELEQFDRVEVHVRGDVMGRRLKRSWLPPFKEVEVEVPVYRRLVVVYRFDPELGLTDDGDVLRIRLFKNIPKMDVDMMLPGGRPQFNLFDRGKILLPTFSGVAIALYKVIRLIAFAAVVKTFSVLTLIVGAIGYIIKSVFGYYNTRDKYQLNLTSQPVFPASGQQRGSGPSRRGRSGGARGPRVHAGLLRALARSAARGLDRR